MPAAPLDALRALSRHAEIDALHVVSIPMTVRFRGIETREAVIMRGPAGWAEFSPFVEYESAEAKNWLAAALDQATREYPRPLRPAVPINATVPVVPATKAHEIARSFGASTAKVKVADPRVSHQDDLARLEAVRDALGPGTKIRVDANAAWSVDEAARKIPELDRAAGGLEYVEQPVPTVTELAAVRAKTGVPIAADESVRRAEDPLAVARAGAADILVMKAQPLGGVHRALELAHDAGLPVVVSSALETSVGLSAGLAFAAALEDLPHACGLGTARLLTGDVTPAPLLSADGTLPTGRATAREELIGQHRAAPAREAWWCERIIACAALL